MVLFIGDASVEPRWKRLFDLHTLVINADNGPESNGRRTQWLKCLVELSDNHQLTVQLAYYPPYHSKYNPVERLWGVLENHWRGVIADSVDKALGLARSMTYRGTKPTVRKVAREYRKGIPVAKKVMQDIEARLERAAGLEAWFIRMNAYVLSALDTMIVVQDTFDHKPHGTWRKGCSRARLPHATKPLKAVCNTLPIYPLLYKAGDNQTAATNDSETKHESNRIPPVWANHRARRTNRI